MSQRTPLRTVTPPLILTLVSLLVILTLPLALPFLGQQAVLRSVEEANDHTASVYETLDENPDAPSRMTQEPVVPAYNAAAYFQETIVIQPTYSDGGLWLLQWLFTGWYTTEDVGSSGRPSDTLSPDSIPCQTTRPSRWYQYVLQFFSAPCEPAAQPAPDPLPPAGTDCACTQNASGEWDCTGTCEPCAQEMERTNLQSALPVEAIVKESALTAGIILPEGWCCKSHFGTTLDDLQCYKATGISYECLPGDLMVSTDSTIYPFYPNDEVGGGYSACKKKCQKQVFCKNIKTGCCAANMMSAEQFYDSSTNIYTVCSKLFSKDYVGDLNSKPFYDGQTCNDYFDSTVPVCGKPLPAPCIPNKEPVRPTTWCCNPAAAKQCQLQTIPDNYQDLPCKPIDGFDGRQFPTAHACSNLCGTNADGSPKKVWCYSSQTNTCAEQAPDPYNGTQPCGPPPWKQHFETKQKCEEFRRKILCCAPNSGDPSARQSCQVLGPFAKPENSYARCPGSEYTGIYLDPALYTDPPRGPTAAEMTQCAASCCNQTGRECVTKPCCDTAGTLCVETRNGPICKPGRPDLCAELGAKCVDGAAGSIENGITTVPCCNATVKGSEKVTCENPGKANSRCCKPKGTTCSPGGSDCCSGLTCKRDASNMFSECVEETAGAPQNK